MVSPPASAAPPASAVHLAASSFLRAFADAAAAVPDGFALEAAHSATGVRWAACLTGAPQAGCVAAAPPNDSVPDDYWVAQQPAGHSAPVDLVAAGHWAVAGSVPDDYSVALRDGHSAPARPVDCSVQVGLAAADCSAVGLVPDDYSVVQREHFAPVLQDGYSLPVDLAAAGCWAQVDYLEQAGWVLGHSQPADCLAGLLVHCLAGYWTDPCWE